MNDKSKGIVISNNEYKENDSLLKVLTKDYGVLGFIVRGTKKMTSKRTGTIQLGNQAMFYFDYKERSGLQQLKQVELIDSYLNVQKDLLKQGIRQYVCELINKLDPTDIDLFDMLDQFLCELNTTTHPLLLLAVFQARINALFGIAMQVDSCVLCANTSGIVSISIDHGGFICTNCATSSMRKEEVYFLRNFRYIVKCELTQIDQLVAIIDEDDRYFMLLSDSFEQYSGFTMKSKRFLESLITINKK